MDVAEQYLSGKAARATFALLGLSAAGVGLASGVVSLRVYQLARPRGIWGSDQPPDRLTENVVFPATDGTRLSGWFLRASAFQPAPTVIICHGLYTGRREGLPWALRLVEAGYNVLCFDFRAHGLSGGRYTTAGYYETGDVLGALGFVLSRPDVDVHRIGLLGFSMGAAASLQAGARCTRVAAVVADSAYASFVDAVHSSFRRVGKLPRYPFQPLALSAGRWLVGADPGALRPVDWIDQISPRPVFIIHGELDAIVPVRHARLLFLAAGEPKELWMVPGAHHVGARDIDPGAYFARVAGFFRQAFAATLAEPSGGGPDARCVPNTATVAGGIPFDPQTSQKRAAA
jgi:uncharacterized protein